MMRLWGWGSGLFAAALCLLREGRVRLVRRVLPSRTRCQPGFASWFEDGEAMPSHATMMRAWLHS
jgi:hypothetical protein